MLRIVCIHGNANYSQSEILRFQFFLVGEHAKNLFPLCMPVKFLGHADLPFFIPAGLTALDTERSTFNSGAEQYCSGAETASKAAFLV